MLPCVGRNRPRVDRSPLVDLIVSLLSANGFLFFFFGEGRSYSKVGRRGARSRG